MKKDLRIAQAVGELAEAMEFVLNLPDFGPEKAVEEIEEKYPEFVERFEAMKNIDEEDFFMQFRYWVLNKRFREKYPDIWEEIKDAFFQSRAAKRIHDKFLLGGHVERQIEDILKDTDFLQEE